MPNHASNLPRLALAAQLVLTLTSGAARAQGSSATRSDNPPSPALAGGSSTAQTLLSTCRRDYRAHCTGNNPAPTVLAGCLSQYYLNLTRDCQAALDSYNAAETGSAPDE